MTGDEQVVSATARRYARGTIVGAVVIVVVWHTVNDTPATILSWAGYQWPEAAAGAWFLYSAIGVFAAADLLRGRSTVRKRWLWAGAALGLSALVAVLCGGDVVTFQNWGWGSVGWLAVLLFWDRPLVVLAGFLLANVAVNGAIMVLLHPPDRTAVARFTMIVYGSIALQLAFAVGARALAATAGKAARAAVARNATITEGLVAEAADRVRQQRYQALQRSTAPVIAKLADGTSDPADEAVRRTCAVESARLRRLLAESDDVPNALLHELRACADVAERRRVVVDFAVSGVVPSLDVGVRHLLAEPLIEVLSTTRTAARVTVIGLPDEVRVSVIADAADLATTRSDDRVVTGSHREGDRLWTEAIWRRPSPSPSSKTTRWSSPGSGTGSTPTAGGG
ncbi:hypothetical protein ACWEGE_44910 [Amycolatopsis sp. NPDC004747]